MDFFVIFVNVIKVFVMVSREGLCKIMENFSCFSKFIIIYYDMMVKIFDDRDGLEVFLLINSVK